MVYYNDKNITIRPMIESDINNLVVGFREQGWNKEASLFKTYYQEQEKDEKIVVIAEYKKEVCGYITIILNTKSGPFKDDNMPELIDFNVLIKYQKKGIGSKILDVCEDIVKSHGYKNISLGVGLHEGYGNAQRLYIKRGYCLDGSGVWYNGRVLTPYADCKNDDDLVLYLSKSL